MKPPIHSRKHISQISQATVGQGLIVTTTFVQAIEGTVSDPIQVSEGALVKACYVEFWVSQDSASTVGSYTVALYKNPGNTNTAATGNMAALHDWSNKKNLLFTAQGLLTPNDGGQVPVMRSWYKIPKGKQRMGLGDTMQITIRNNNAAAIDINFCGLVIYKEYQ